MNKRIFLYTSPWLVTLVKVKDSFIVNDEQPENIVLHASNLQRNPVIVEKIIAHKQSQVDGQELNLH